MSSDTSSMNGTKIIAFGVIFGVIFIVISMLFCLLGRKKREATSVVPTSSLYKANHFRLTREPATDLFVATVARPDPPRAASMPLVALPIHDMPVRPTGAYNLDVDVERAV